MSHIINGLQSIGVSPTLAAQITKEATENITPSKNDGELATSIALNHVLMGLFDQAEKDGVRKDTLIMKLLDLLKEPGEYQESEETINVGDEFFVPTLEDVPDDGFAPDALDDLDPSINDTEHNTGNKKGSFRLSGKQILVITVVVGLVIFYFVWGNILSAALSTQLPHKATVRNGGIHASGVAPAQGKKKVGGYTLTVATKEKGNGGYIVPPEDAPTQAGKEFGGKFPPRGGEGRDKPDVAISNPRSGNYAVEAGKTKERHKEERGIKTYSMITSTPKNPSPHKSIGNSSKKENRLTIPSLGEFKPKMTIEKTRTTANTLTPETQKDGGEAEEGSGGVCNVGEEYVGGEYVYYTLKRGKYVPAYRNPNWDQKGVVLTRRMVVNHHSEETGFVDIGRGRYLPVDFFSECTVF